MASIRLVPKEEATGTAKELYDEIKAEHGIDFSEIPSAATRGAGRDAFA